MLPVLSLLFERVLKGQYGFRLGHSTAMAILDMVERVREYGVCLFKGTKRGWGATGMIRDRGRAGGKGGGGLILGSLGG